MLSLYINFALQRFERNKDELSRDVTGILHAIAEQTPDIIIFGDSVLERTSREDTDKRSLAQMIFDIAQPSLRTEYISYSAYHMGVYYLLLKVIYLMKQSPSRLIIPINMRSFSPQWHLNPLFRCHQHIKLLKDFIEVEQHSIVPELYGTDRMIGLREFFNTSAQQQLSACKKVSDYLNIIHTAPTTSAEKDHRFKQLFIYHYLLPLSIHHPKLRLLSDVLKLAKECNSKVFLYTTPINYEGGVQYVGRDFLDHFSVNVGTVKKCLAATGHTISSSTSTLRGQFFTFCDFSVSLDHMHFFNPHESTEHLNERGRKALARMIAEKSELSL